MSFYTAVTLQPTHQYCDIYYLWPIYVSLWIHNLLNQFKLGNKGIVHNFTNICCQLHNKSLVMSANKPSQILKNLFRLGNIFPTLLAMRVCIEWTARIPTVTDIWWMPVQILKLKHQPLSITMIKKGASFMVLLKVHCF